MSDGTERSTRRTLACLTLAGMILAAVPLKGAPLADVPQTLLQPDGRVIQAWASGDEFYNWIHDDRGFVIMLGEEGWWVWAQRVDGHVAATVYRVGEVDPIEVGLVPHIMPDSRVTRDRSRWLEESPEPPGLPRESPSAMSNINNVVVFIRFSDEAEFGDQISLYQQRFNTTGAGAISMKSYFQAVSYNALAIDSHFFPNPTTMVVSYQNGQPRNYYRPYNATTNPIGYQGGPNGTERRTREHSMLRDAVNAVAAQVPAGLDLDNNADGRVDNVCFIIRGGPDGWSDLLWPHRWSLYTYNVTLHGKRVWDYNFNLQSMVDVAVLSHEMFHTLGAPDLYHYDSAYQYLQPVWRWDIMESSTNPPQHMGAHMKIRYGGWLPAAPLITVPGTFTLNPLTSPTGSVYRVNSSDANQYYLMEYRQKAASGFESAIPGTGLLVYRIDSRRQGNASGPPDEVYIYRPNGTLTVNGSPGSAHFSAAVGRNRINDSTNPSGFLQEGTSGGLSLSGVGTAGDTISFTIDGIIVQRAGNGTVTSTPSRIDCGSACAGMFQYGSTVALSAAPAAGQRFAGWGGVCTGTGGCSVTISGAHTVTAVFEPIPTPHTLTVACQGTGTGLVTSDPAGIDCPGTCQAVFSQGAVVSLAAIAESGSMFAGWTGSCSGSSSCFVTMSQAQAVTATFSLLPAPLEPVGLGVDGLSGGGATGNLNGILEPGEVVAVTPNWYNPGSGSVVATGLANGLNGPGSGYSLVDASASYGTIAPGATADCGSATGDCYQVALDVPSSRPNLHWDLVFTEMLSTGVTKTWTIHVGNSFADVEVGHWAYSFVEPLLHSSVTTGCDPGQRLYCPAGNVDRAQMAVFLARALAGGDAAVPSSGTIPGIGAYQCGPEGVSQFTDVLPGDWFCRHAHLLWSEQVTTGCDPVNRRYCPGNVVSRDQMAVFLARARRGGEAEVPMAYSDGGTGRSYDCSSGSSAFFFTDVPSSHWACKHVHYLWATAVIAGCDPGSGLYCPTPPVRRDEMAKFLVNGFGLTLE